MTHSHSEEFATYLQKLADSASGDNPREGSGRAALATLRRALTGKPDDVLRTFRYIGFLLPNQPDAQDLYILVAGLFASHPLSTDSGTLGHHLARLRDEARDKDDTQMATRLDKRLAAMLQIRAVHLGPHLRRMVAFLKAGQIPVNWAQLLRDLRNWDDPQGYVQRCWATAFWGKKRSDKAASVDTENQH